MSKSKLGHNPFQLKTTPVEKNPLFSEEQKTSRAAETLGQADPVGVLFAADEPEDEQDEQSAPVGLVVFGLLKGYALIRGLISK